MYESIVFELSQLADVVQHIKKIIDAYSIITLTGELGAGKTTLTKALLKSYGVDEIITSPTFTYVNCYANAHHDIFYHFDLYRIVDAQQFTDAGFDEYLVQSGAKVFIEWPERIAELLPEKRCAITIEHHGAYSRRISIKKGDD